LELIRRFVSIRYSLFVDMKKLNLPSFPFKIKSDNGRKQIFDEIRKKYVALTPEEWVRQHLARYLITIKSYPAGLMAIETQVKYNRMNKRSDLVVYQQSGKPLLIAECKAPTVKITQDAFDQVARYNMALRVKYVVVTNGLKHYCCMMDYTNHKTAFLESIPDYELETVSK